MKWEKGDVLYEDDLQFYTDHKNFGSRGSEPVARLSFSLRDNFLHSTPLAIEALWSVVTKN